MATMTGCKIGTIVLKAGGQEFPCTALSLHMSINNIPSATVVVGCGDLIANPEKKVASAEDLLSQVLSRHKQAYLEMVECSIMEDLDGARTTIFKGVIVAGYVMYKTGTPTIRAIKFQCMNQACKLYVAPLSAHRNICGASIVKYMNDTDAYAKEKIDKSAFLFSMGNQLDADHIREQVLKRGHGQSLAKLVAGVVNEIVAAESEGAKGELSGKDITHVADYLYSNYKVNAGTLSPDSEEAFVRELTAGILQAIYSGSIYEAIQRTILSNSFMLNIVPRWSDQNFKLEIAPTRAWITTGRVVVGADNVISMDSVYKPLVCLNTPDAFIAHFDTSEELMKAAAAQQVATSGINGVFSTNPELLETLKARFQTGGNVPLKTQALDEHLFKTKYYPAPTWLYNIFMKVSQTENERKPAAKAKHTTASNQTGAKSNTLEEAEAAVAQVNVQKERELADLVAKALFNHLFGAGDTAYVRVLPSLRFKWFEANLGNVLDIRFDNTKKLSASPLNIRGMLQAVHYEYSSGTSSTVSYTIELSRVRPVDPSEKSIECPLYQRIK